MKKLVLLTLALLFNVILFAQSSLGKWVSIDDKTGKKKSIVELGHRLSDSHRTKSQSHGDGFVHDCG